MSQKKSKNKQMNNENKGYNQNQQANDSFNNELVSDKYKNNSNTQA